MRLNFIRTVKFKFMTNFLHTLTGFLSCFQRKFTLIILLIKELIIHAGIIIIIIYGYSIEIDKN